LNLSTAIILGIVQGLTELFPVSSSAHLVILQSFFTDFRQPGVAFDVILHLGTLFAIAFYFRAEIINIVRGLIPARLLSVSSPIDAGVSRRFVLLIVIGTIPVVIAGLLFRKTIHQTFESAQVAAFFLLITGLLLFLSDRVQNVRRETKEMTLTDSILIGIAQAFALLPGISRSGATITAAIFLKIDRTEAARFSFLLSLPAVCGAVILESGYLRYISSADILPYIAGFISAALAGFLSLKLFFLVIRKARLKYFAYYCWILGTLTLLLAGQ
jgi:undecaprenyl-diphosphatase